MEKQQATEALKVKQKKYSNEKENADGKVYAAPDMNITCKQIISALKLYQRFDDDEIISNELFAVVSNRVKIKVLNYKDDYFVNLRYQIDLIYDNINREVNKHVEVDPKSQQ